MRQLKAGDTFSIKVGDKFALGTNETEGNLPLLPEGLNWAKKESRSGLVVYEVLPRDDEATFKKWEGTGVHEILTTNKEARKHTPIFSGCLRYFPKALAAVAALSQIGNEQHNPGTPLHWDRSKSGDEWDALARHLLEVGACDTDGVLHSAKVAWRALAGLQKELEDSERTDARPVHPAADAGRSASCSDGGPGA